jgi:cephalosporin hydroxylase
MTKRADDPIALFEEECRQSIARYPEAVDWQDMSARWMEAAFRYRYMYNFRWLGRPIIQVPTDMVAFQEVVWAVKPDLIIETGIAHGGSLILSASLLSLIDVCEAITQGESFDPSRPARKVIGVDIDIRKHNRRAIEAHPLSRYIDMVEGSSLADETVAEVGRKAQGFARVLVALDSNHTHAHVMKELELYSPFTSIGSYCIVFDTIVETLPADMFPDRPWKPGDNPRTAVWAFLQLLKSEGRTAADGKPLSFVIDKAIEDKLLLSVAPDGFLKRV